MSAVTHVVSQATVFVVLPSSYPLVHCIVYKSALSCINLPVVELEIPELSNDDVGNKEKYLIGSLGHFTKIIYLRIQYIYLLK